MKHVYAMVSIACIVYVLVRLVDLLVEAGE